MSSPLNDTQREVLPRWRSLKDTIRAGEMTPARSDSLSLPEDFLADKILAWRSEQSLPFAIEAVGAALVLGRQAEAADAAEFVLARRADTTAAAIKLAEQVLGSPEPRESRRFDQALVRNAIRELRHRIRYHPRNAFGWAELARNYALLGLLPKAIAAMSVAVGLGPNNRYILRAASRLYAHCGDFERAHHVLLASAGTRTDPWLVAAEIGAASLANRSPILAKAGQHLLDSEHFNLFDTAELASALGTLHAKGANLRRARKLLGRSLKAPNENVIAQARWAAKAQIIDIDDPKIFLSSKEASAWHSFYSGDWNDSLLAARSWLYDQRFSAKPAVHGSYVAGSILEDHEEALRFANAGLLSNPHHPSLLNNRAYSLANLGRLEEAEAAFSSLFKYGDRNRLTSMKTVLLATAGLLSYRRRDLAKGRELYTMAIANAERDGDRRLAAKAATFYALEEIRVGDDFAPTVARALDLGREFIDTEFDVLRQRIESAVLKQRSHD